MAFSRARDFDILDSEFIDVAGNYNHQTTTSMSQVIGGSSEYLDVFGCKISHPTQLQIAGR